MDNIGGFLPFDPAGLKAGGFNYILLAYGGKKKVLEGFNYSKANSALTSSSKEYTVD